MNLMLRRRVMMTGSGQDPNDYIKRGLVFHLDGADFDGTEWVDRVGGITYTTNISASATSDGGVALYESLLIGDGLVNVIYDVGTFEIVYKSNRTSSWDMVFFQGQHGYFMYAVTQGRASWHGGEKVETKVTGVTTSVFTHSLSNIHNYFNKESKGNGSVATWKNLFSPSLIGRYPINYNYPTEYAAIGSLYQIRIYKRQLSFNEIMHNAEIDISKYNITL